MGRFQIACGPALSTCLLLTVRLASGGEAPRVEWTRVLSQSVQEGVGAPLQQTSDGGFIVSGSTLKKTDGRGNVLWETSFEDPIYPGSAVRQTSDGGYIVGGTFYGPGCNSPHVTSQDLALIRVDPQGTILWQKAFGRSGQDWGYAVETTRDGGYVVAGFISGSGSGSLAVVK